MAVTAILISEVIELKEFIFDNLAYKYIKPCLQIQNGCSGHFEYICVD